MPASPSDLARLLRGFRLRAGFSQDDLAGRSGVSARSISDLERGLRKSARPETLRMLAETLQLSEEDRSRLIAAAHPEFDSNRLEDGAPFATAIPLARRTLPIAPGALIGRESDVAAIGELIREDGARLVTLTGPGGVGKTRLVLEMAGRLQHQWGEGAAFVDLAPITGQRHVAPAVAAALGLTLDPLLDPEKAILLALQDRELLLVLDNMEHLLDSSAWIAELLARCRRLAVLVTSRVRLRIRAEHVYPVAPLAVPLAPDGAADTLAADLLHSPAVRLFRARARQAGYGFTLDDTNASVVAELCRQLDGLPLAIELAASRAGLFPPESLLDQLQTLSGGPRDAPERQQTLPHAIGWSYDLLDPAVQTVYRRLSVFAGGFTLDAAERVAGEDDAGIPGSVAALIESSLLTRIPTSDPSRYTMLETIHRDAAARLASSGELEVVCDRHVSWITWLLETADLDLVQCRGSASWYPRLDAELDNLRAAIRFLIRVGDGDRVNQILAAASVYSMDRIPPQEGYDWALAAIPLVKHGPNAESVLGLSDGVVYATFLGDLDTAGRLASRMREDEARVDDPLANGVSHLAQGIYYQFRGDLTQSAVHHEHALERFRALERPAYIYFTMFELGHVWLLQGKHEEARRLIEEGIALTHRTESTSELAYGSLYLGLATVGRETAIAADAFRQALLSAQAHRIDRVAVSALCGLAAVALESGDLDDAACLLGAAEAARRSSGIEVLAAPTFVAPILQLAETLLGQERYRTLLLEGAALTYDQATRMAMEIAAIHVGDRQTVPPHRTDPMPA